MLGLDQPLASELGKLLRRLLACIASSIAQR